MNDHAANEEHLESSDFISDIVIGISDGLTVPFALAAGLVSAVDSNLIITTAGIAEIAAGSIAMGLGGYLAGRTEIDHYKSELKREYEEVEIYPDKERQEVMDVFEEYGISKELQVAVADEMSKDKDQWVRFMMRFELGLEEPHPKRAVRSALNIGVAYIVGGLIPMIPYFITETPLEGLQWSTIITVVCLAIFGYFKSKVTGQPLWVGTLKVVVIGVLAAGAAFAIASLLS
ncbi:MAG: VIT1/CCC1 transporter family protein [Flavobacteriales bacterium]|nr:VIT1/CCC1 transporter family protein [Bacteroidota bacterium]MCB9241064.1 VIT1/CCC1 transporter family protein [Flavobacteriales bacterium]